ncbi:MAG: chemotaxis protein CheW [Magnetococcales bacterium]|nr:chemotaxis protein CheW [Magnetococcales bacterium]
MHATSDKRNQRSMTQRVLTLTLDGDLYALDIFSVREILDVSQITRIPQAQDCMLGVVNLRGNAVPVMDLRRRFGLPHGQRTVNSRIIIMEFLHDQDLYLIGALADSVKEVLELDPAQVAPPPRMGTKAPIDFITGICRHNDRFIILLDASKVFSLEELVNAALLSGSVPQETAPPQQSPGSGEMP